METTTKTETNTLTPEIKMEIGLTKDKGGAYVLTKNKVMCFCPFQLPSVGKSISGDMVQSTPACNSNCAMFHLDDSVYNNMTEKTGEFRVVLSCGGNKVEHIIEKVNIK